jgi:hypothetical protein
MTEPGNATPPPTLSESCSNHHRRSTHEGKSAPAGVRRLHLVASNDAQLASTPGTGEQEGVR